MVAGLDTAACTPLKEPPAQLRDKSDLDCALDHYFAFPEYRENGVTREEIVQYVEVWSWGDHITAAEAVRRTSKDGQARPSWH